MIRLRSAAVTTALCGTVVLAGWAVSGLSGFGSPRIEEPNLASIENQRAASLSAKTESVTANTEPMDAPQLTAIDKTGASDGDRVGRQGVQARIGPYQSLKLR